MRRDYNCSRYQTADLFRMARARKHGIVALRDLLVEYVEQSIERGLFDTLRYIDYPLSFPDIGTYKMRSGTYKRRSNGKYDELGIGCFAGVLIVAGELHRIREHGARKVLDIAAVCLESLYLILQL